MPRALFWLAMADFLERIRRRSFLVAALAMVVLATLYLPARDASYITITIGDNVRGLYDSAWIGVVIACLSSLTFSLAGFYLVRGAVDRDEKTRFGQVLAATPVSGIEYVLGKSLSNFCYLASLTGLVALTGVALQLVRAEDLAVNPVELLLPTVIVVWPTMLLVAAIAVLFECVPPLRSGLGSVAYFALYICTVAAGTFAGGIYESGPDPLGVRVLLVSMARAANSAAPTSGSGPEPNIGVNASPANLRTFDFSGLDLSVEMLLARVVWASASFVAVLVAALFFSRFDPARRRTLSLSTLVPTGLRGRPYGLPLQRNHRETVEKMKARAPSTLPGKSEVATIPSLDDGLSKGRLASLVAAEIKLMLKGRSRLWYAGALALVLAGLLLPLENARAIILPLAWLWPILLWSSLGCRERINGTADTVFSTPGTRNRAVLAGFLAGVLVALLLASGVATNMALTGEVSGLLGIVAGAMFVPALAIACGALSGGSTLFEGIYLPLWYAGPLNKVAALDFAAITGLGCQLAYLAATTVLVFLAFAARTRS